MDRCSAAGNDLFGICVKSLYEATQDEEIFEETWEVNSGGCPLCTKYVDSVRLEHVREQKADCSTLQHHLRRAPEGIPRTCYQRRNEVDKTNEMRP